MDKSEGKDWFAKTLNNVTEETAKVYKISRLKLEINSFNKTYNEKMHKISKRLLKLIEQGEIDASLFEPEYSSIMQISEKIEEMEAEVLPYDFFFEDEEGNVYDANDVQEDSRALCSHDFCVQGTSTTHNKDGNGGCVVRKFESVKCIYCNTIKVGNLISSTTYTTCPH